jgi:hypothetical protein
MGEMSPAAGVLSEEEALMLLLLLLLPTLETTSTFFFSLQQPLRKAATGYTAAGCFLKTGEAVRPVARSAGMAAAATAPAKLPWQDAHRCSSCITKDFKTFNLLPQHQIFAGKLFPDVDALEGWKG